MSYSVVCIRWDGEFDHSQGFETLREATDYIAAQQPRNVGCTFRICHADMPYHIQEPE
jgi:hypothetical protein